MDAWGGDREMMTQSKCSLFCFGAIGAATMSIWCNLECLWMLFHPFKVPVISWINFTFFFSHWWVVCTDQLDNKLLGSDRRLLLFFFLLFFSQCMYSTKIPNPGNQAFMMSQRALILQCFLSLLTGGTSSQGSALHGCLVFNALLKLDSTTKLTF